MNLSQDVSLDMLTKGIDPGTMRILYYQNKGYLVSVVIIITCFLLFLFLIIPQIQNVFSIKAQEEEYRQKIAVLKENVAFLSLLDDNQLSSQTQLVAKALPTEKDFVNILYAISSVADNSDVSLGDFAFGIGDISPSASAEGLRPSVQVEISIRGDTAGVRRFIATLAKRIPLSEVISLSGNSSGASMVVNFYYRSLPSFTFDDNSRIPAQSKADGELLQTLEAWQPAGSQLLTPSSTSSAGKLLGPFQ